VRTAHPSISELRTGNAARNAAMLAVNARLGFVAHRVYGAYQIDRDRLGAWTSASD
jgi:hypothetical protein